MGKVLARKLEFKQLGSIAMKSTRCAGYFYSGHLNFSCQMIRGVKCSV
jgi:hypothetical protein